MTQHRPSKADLQAAYSAHVPDVAGPGMKVLFCGINPSLYSVVVQHHFARPGNRFWPTLHAAGFTPRVLAPSEEQELVGLGYGITNVVERATATADELSPEELVAGGERLAQRVQRYRPDWLAVLGITAYRTAFGRSKAVLGPQPERVGGARVWVLPNPSGLNAHYQLPDLAEKYRALRLASTLDE